MTSRRGSRSSAGDTYDNLGDISIADNILLVIKETVNTAMAAFRKELEDIFSTKITSLEKQINILTGVMTELKHEGESRGDETQINILTGVMTELKHEGKSRGNETQINILTGVMTEQKHEGESRGNETQINILTGVMTELKHEGESRETISIN